MRDSENILQKAFYLGVGIASYAAEKAQDTIEELQKQAEKFKVDQDLPLRLQQLADDMVAKGKITTDEARIFVDEMIRKSQANIADQSSEESKKPRTIEIISDDDDE